MQQRSNKVLLSHNFPASTKRPNFSLKVNDESTTGSKSHIIPDNQYRDKANCRMLCYSFFNCKQVSFPQILTRTFPLFQREYLLLNGVDHNLGEGRQKSVRTQLRRTGQDSQRLILEVVTVI